LSVSIGLADSSENLSSLLMADSSEIVVFDGVIWRFLRCCVDVWLILVVWCNFEISVMWVSDCGGIVSGRKI
jgi:hypothetical protein